MQDNVHTEEYKGCNIEISYDEFTESPREDDNLTTMICLHSDYILGDMHDYKQGDYNSWEEIEEQIKKDFGRCTIQPLYLYDHSGLTISTGRFSCSWDSGQIGFIVISNVVIKENWGKVKNIRKKALEVIESEIKCYEDYLQGHVYSYNILDEKGNDLDSCGGFIGDYDSYILEEARMVIDCHIMNKLKERFIKLKQLIKNKVPLIYRQSILAEV